MEGEGTSGEPIPIGEVPEELNMEFVEGEAVVEIEVFVELMELIESMELVELAEQVTGVQAM